MKTVLFEKKFWLLRHIMFWIFVYLDEFLAFIGVVDPYEEYYSILYSLALDMMLVYFVLYVLIPKFLSKKKYFLFAFGVISGLAIVVTLNYFDTIREIPDDVEIYAWDIIFDTTLTTIGIVGMAIAIKMLKLNYLEKEQLHELQKLQIGTELKYLKKHVNPHFLFNALNNVYVLSKKEPKKVPDAILKLSDLMRFQTYDASMEFVSFRKEIEFINNFLDLEKMRRTRLDIQTNIEGNYNSALIEPLLFLPFVENATKFSQGVDGKKEYIDIKWKFNGSKIYFKIKNSKGVERNDYKNDSGFGLENVKKRLELLYPDEHSLHLKNSDTEYSAELILEKHG